MQSVPEVISVLIALNYHNHAQPALIPHTLVADIAVNVPVAITT